MTHDPTPEALAVIQTVIKLATPRQSYRGKQDRNRLVRQAIDACKTMTHDKRVNK